MDVRCRRDPEGPHYLNENRIKLKRFIKPDMISSGNLKYKVHFFNLIMEKSQNKNTNKSEEILTSESFPIVTKSFSTFHCFKILWNIENYWLRSNYRNAEKLQVSYSNIPIQNFSQPRFLRAPVRNRLQVLPLLNIYYVQSNKLNSHND